MLSDPTLTAPDVSDQLDRYPLFDALLHRRSRRFGLGMKMEHGPFAFTSRYAPKPLTEDEEAALAFAACGVTGYALADLAYARGEGGQMLAGMLGRTAGSGDAINCVSVVVTNDQATYLLKRPQDFAPAEYRELVQLAQAGELTELYRRSRIKIADGRIAPSTKPGYNFNVNKWSLYAQGSSYLLPINEITALYINALLEAFEPEMGYFVVDERNNLQPAGLARFAKSKGGHLDDSLAEERVGTIQFIETALIEATAVEQGMVLQNVALMAQALGLGGFPHFAKHEYSWLQALNFRTEFMPATRYLGASGLVSLAARLTNREQPVPLAVGLERNGQVLLKPYSPPYYTNMTEAVRAFVAYKFGPQGIFRGGAAHSGWREPARVSATIPAPSEAAIEATIAYCEYVYQRYGRFPAYSPPFRTMLGYQATHVDLEFYERFYRPEALSETQRAAWARNQLR